MFGLLCLFFLSGVTSLIYETLWIRVLSLGVGSTSASMSLVLAVFFLGLSLGSYCCGLHIHRLKSPLKTYAVLETIIGLYSAILIYPLFHTNQLLSLFLTSSVGVWAALVKLVLVTVLLAVPTFAMGATLPLLIRYALQKGAQMGASTTLLYGINTLGGVSGALVGSFFLMPKLGIIWTNHLAVAANLLVALAALLLDRAPTSSSISEASQEFVKLPIKVRRAILVAAGVCGFVSIASEVVWNKYLGIYFGTNIYGLGLILALYLIGIALGSLLLSKIFPLIKKNPVQFFNILFIASLALLFLASYLFNWAPVLVTHLYFAFGERVSLLTVKSLVTALILFIPTSVFGALFPLSVTLLSPSKEEAPKWVGLAYAINTIGAILGSYLSGIVLIPAFGSSVTIRIIVLVGVVSAIWLVWVAARKPIYWGVLAILVLSVLSLQNLDFRNLLKSAYHRTGNTLQEELARYTEGFEEFKTIIEGETGIISLSHDPKDGLYYKNYLRLKNNGLNESVYDGFRPQELPRYEALIGLLPYLFSPQLSSAFLVGYGGGYTIDFLSSMPIGRVDIVELERGILEAAEIVRPNNPLLKRPNVNLLIEDARYILATHQLGKHDIIISQPSHSWLAGAANLFTEDFFRIVKEGLNPKGVFSQWLNLYNMDVTVLKSILNTFYTVFPYGAVFTNVGDQELVLIGSLQPLKLQWERLQTLTATGSPYVARLAGIPLAKPTDLLAHYSFSREEALALAGNSILNSDRNVYAETRQSQLFYRDRQGEMSPQAFLSTAYRGNIESLVPENISRSPDFLYQVIFAMKEEQQYDKIHTLLKKFETLYGNDKKYFWHLGYLCVRAQRYESAERYLRAEMKEKPSVGVLTLLLAALIDNRRYADAVKVMNQYRMRDAASECYLADALLHGKGVVAAESIYQKIFSRYAEYSKACGDYIHRLVGDYYFSRGEHQRSLSFFEAYTKVFPHDSLVLRKMVKSYKAVSRPEKSQHFAKFAVTAAETEVQQLNELARFYRDSKLVGDATFLEKRANFVGSHAE